MQDLYELDRSFSREIDRISRDEGYVDELLQLPESELIQLVNYLDDVGFSSVKLIQLIVTSIHRPLAVSPTLTYHPESVCTCYRRYVVPEESSPPPSTCLGPFCPPKKLGPGNSLTDTRVLSARKFASRTFEYTHMAIRMRPKKYLIYGLQSDRHP